MNSIFLRIPATTANLGPGFDVFGLALNLYNYFYIEFLKDANFEIYLNNKILFSDISTNLIFQSYTNVLKHYSYKENEIPRWRATIQIDVPIGKGFGSSATAIVAGVEIAKYVLSIEKDIHLTLEEEIQFYLDLENHPDNVVPARLGGWVFYYEPKIIIRKQLPEDLGICILIPDFQIHTKESRKKLKNMYSIREVLSNIKGCLLWLEYINTRNPTFLEIALSSDTLHEPIRYLSIPYIEDLKKLIKKFEFYGMTLSGSGPGILLYYDKNKENYFKEKIIEMKHLLNYERNHKINYKFCIPDYEGTVFYEKPIKNFFVEENETFINL
ncbi:MAG: homoserine kinase [Leptonema sp. (in: bacteria)]